MQQHIQARHWQAVNKYHALCFCQSAPCAVVFALLSIAAGKCIMLALSLGSCTGGRRGKPCLVQWVKHGICNPFVLWSNWSVMCPCNVCRVGLSVRGICLSISFLLPLKGLHLTSWAHLKMFSPVWWVEPSKNSTSSHPAWLNGSGSGMWC